MLPPGLASPTMAFGNPATNIDAGNFGTVTGFAANWGRRRHMCAVLARAGHYRAGKPPHLLVDDTPARRRGFGSSFMFAQSLRAQFRAGTSLG